MAWCSRMAGRARAGRATEPHVGQCRAGMTLSAELAGARLPTRHGPMSESGATSGLGGSEPNPICALESTPDV